MTTAAIAAVATSAIVKAAQAIGDKLFDSATGAVADEGANLGRRLLDRLLGRHRDQATEHGSADAAPSGGQVALREAVDELAKAPDDADAQASVRVTIRRLLDADPDLFRDVQALLPRTVNTIAGERSVVIGGDNSEIIITGDGNRVQR